MGVAFDVGIQDAMVKIARGISDATGVVDIKPMAGTAAGKSRSPGFGTAGSRVKPRVPRPSRAEVSSWAKHRDKVMKPLKGKRQVIDSPFKPKPKAIQAGGSKLKKGLAIGAVGLGIAGTAALALKRRRAKQQRQGG